MIPLNVTLSYYKRKDIQEEMVIAAKNREVAIRFNDHFGQRPDVLNNPADILELAKQKATSFHISEELWKNPLQLSLKLKKHETEELRIGWDLVLDIDCGIFEYSRIAADIIIKALKFHNVKSVSCKFSGNKGFHIGVPFESFPETIRGEKTSSLFPDAPRRVALYIKEMIKNNVSKDILKFENGNFENIVKKTQKKVKEITRYEKNEYGDNIATLDAEPFLVIDTILISSRHMFRMPYSLHEKSHLASIPINPDKVLEFEKEHANPKNIIISKYRFLDKENIIRNDAKDLLIQSFDFQPVIEETKAEEKKSLTTFESAVPEELFPPCIKLGLQGLKDGRKRFVFILINFLVSTGWDYDAIEKKLKEWNKKNPESLREVTVLGQLRYHKQQKKKILPPNCSNESYYLDIGICKPDNLCNKIKNPVNYCQRKGFSSKKAVKTQ
ncbi:hypothetical protein CMO93_03750 [Candidatus Woesearchaeota archaeon]|nr:hypothetical protein [Candidatus Woesearchaeota archaeon]